MDQRFNHRRFGRRQHGRDGASKPTHERGRPGRCPLGARYVEAVLLVASRAGSLPVVKALVEGKAKIELRTRHGDTAIMAASFNGHLPVVKYLRESGAAINYKGWTPLLYAAHNGHTAVLKYLLEQGADPTTAAPNGVTALMIAAREGHTEAVNALIDYGVDLNQKNELGQDAVYWADRAELPAMVKLLKAAIAKSK
jgi:uncharacterized protein